MMINTDKIKELEYIKSLIDVAIRNYSDFVIENEVNGNNDVDYNDEYIQKKQHMRFGIRQIQRIYNDAQKE